jgi:hypothetical protein
VLKVIVKAEPQMRTYLRIVDGKEAIKTLSLKLISIRRSYIHKPLGSNITNQGTRNTQIFSRCRLLHSPTNDAHDKAGYTTV